MGLIPSESFCPAVGTIDGDGPPVEQAAISANHVSGQGHFPNYKGLLQLKSKEATNRVKQWAEDLNRHDSQEDVQLLDIPSHQGNAN